jgi:aldehyde:ferredoxin oxidoreductase
MANGYVGKIALVDLSTEKIETIPLEDSICNDFIGGYGLGAKLLYDLQKPGTDALSPESILGFMTGPLTGTPAVTGSRFAVLGKSPLTGTWSDSNCGGYFGPALKMAGYDGIFVRGAARAPVYILAADGKIDIVDAGEIWGKNTSDAEQIIKKQLGDKAQVASIGIAGEKQVLIANIINDEGRAAGRSGFGAVMGSKKLKAVVAKGERDVPLADPQKMQELRKEAIRDMKKDDGLFEAFQNGSGAYTPMGIATGDAPTKNWSGSGWDDFPQGSDWTDKDVYKYRVKKYACYRCPIACGGLVKMESKKYGVLETHQPEYETMAVFSSNCLNDNIESLIKIDNLCNNYGVDTISAGSLVAYVIQCFEEGLITKEDLDGLEMTWGNHEAIVAMTEKIATREGIGDILAGGFQSAIEHLGTRTEPYAMHVRGEALPMHDPRFEPALGLIYKINASPAKHLPASQFFKPPGLDLDIPDFGTDIEKQVERARSIRVLECLNNAMSSAGLCVRGYLSFDVRFLAAFLEAATGKNWTVEGLVEAGERIANMRQAFNLREGVNLIDEKFPRLALGKPPLERGPLAGSSVDIDSMLEAYLEEMDWDKESGIPSRRKLNELGLQNIADDLGSQ